MKRIASSCSQLAAGTLLASLSDVVTRPTTSRRSVSMSKLGALGPAVSLLFVLMTASASADENDLVVGRVVRLTTTRRIVAGTIASVTEQAIMLREGEGDSAVEIPRTELRKLEVMDSGRNAHLKAWGLGGAGIGAGLGLAWSHLDDGCCLGGYGGQDDTPADNTVTEVATGALAFAAVGLIIGKAWERKPQWEEVDLPRPTVRVGVMPTRGRGIGLAVSLSF